MNYAYIVPWLEPKPIFVQKPRFLQCILSHFSKTLVFTLKHEPVATVLWWLAGLAGLVGLGLLSLLYGSRAGPKGRLFVANRILYGWLKTDVTKSPVQKQQFLR